MYPVSLYCVQTLLYSLTVSVITSQILNTEYDIWEAEPRVGSVQVCYQAPLTSYSHSASDALMSSS